MTPPTLSSLLSKATTANRVLIVDDDEQMLRVIQKTLTQAGFTDTRAVSDPRLVLPELRSYEPNIVLLDLRMPQLDGFVVLRQIRNRVAQDEFFPVLVISGDLDEENRTRALLEGASDFLPKPFGTIELVLRVRNLLEARMHAVQSQQIIAAKTLEVREVQDGVADRLAMLAEFRDYSGGPHTQRVGEMAARIAREMELPDDQVAVIRRAAPLHDIGKLAIPDEILLTEGPLSLEQIDVMRTHTTIGATVLSGSNSPVLQMGEEIALYHHENWDGTGYTPGLTAENIPLPARITAVADVFDALRHARPYKEAWSVDRSVERIVEMRGTKFDPTVVDAFQRVVSLEGLPLIEPDPHWQDLAVPFVRHFGQNRAR